MKDDRSEQDKWEKDAGPTAAWAEDGGIIGLCVCACLLSWIGRMPVLHQAKERL